MKFTIVAAFLAAFAAAESIDDLVQNIPSCAVNCIRNAAESVNCGVLDFACTCPKANSLMGTVVSCLVTSGCSQQDQTAVIMTASKICEQFSSGASMTGSLAADATGDAGADASRTTTHASMTGPAGAAAGSTQTPGAAGRVQAAGWAGALAGLAVLAL